MRSVIMLKVTYKPFVLSVVMLSVIMLNVTYKPFVLNVVRLNVVILSVVVPHSLTILSTARSLHK
jgi:hypothetical protein